MAREDDLLVHPFLLRAIFFGETVVVISPADEVFHNDSDVFETDVERI